MRLTHEPAPSTMSELDNLSDSEWLDIASGQDSDDSLSDHDSDHDGINSMPRSRRSSFSNEDSSAASDVEAWEGFVSDAGDDQDALTGFDPSIPLIVTAEEDERVREALDQSFIGTLSSSRSSTLGSGHLPTIHTSIRDLRLSFPDPLTSSRDELNRSFEAVSSPVEATSSSSTDGDVPNDSVPVSSSLPPMADPGSFSATPEVQRHEVQCSEHEEKDADLDIFLYGASSEIKWKFVQQLIHKAGISSDHVLNEIREIENAHKPRSIKCNSILFNTINITDKTDEGLGKADVGILNHSERPSLAIVYLPTFKLPVLAWHDAYLPVLVPSTADEEKNVMLQVAEDDWDLLAVPNHRVIRFGASKSPVFDASDLASADSAHVFQALCGIGHEEDKEALTKPLTEQVKSVNAVTLFALMSLIMGFAINTAFRPPTPSPTPTVNTPSSSSGPLWGILAPQPNRSTLNPSASRGNSKTCESGQTHKGLSSFKDMALSVFIPGSTSLSLTPLPASKGLSVPSTSKGLTVAPASSKCAQCEASTSKASPPPPRQSTDIALRSPDATSLAEIPVVTPAISSMASRTDGGSTIILGGTIGALPKSTISTAASAAVNLNLNHVTEVLGAKGKAIAEAVANDYSEIVEAADGLLSSLREQRDTVIRQSKGKARAFGEQLQNINEALEYRHNRAKRRARDLSAKGGAVLSSAGKLLKDGTMRAQGRAKGIKQTLVEGSSEAWKTYERAHEEWEGVLSGRRHGRTRRNKENVRRGDRIRYEAGVGYDHL
ncbi:hypothetical protein CPC08DRAFT_50077 [Agrocybe pediades]|nr:hypothetical protein CPC08DRAFT_50077 [Agrocybe pediades]